MNVAVQLESPAKIAQAHSVHRGEQDAAVRRHPVPSTFAKTCISAWAWTGHGYVHRHVHGRVRRKIHGHAYRRVCMHTGIDMYTDMSMPPPHHPTLIASSCTNTNLDHKHRSKYQ